VEWIPHGEIMTPSPAQPERAPEPVERFVKQLLVVYKAAKLYPPTSDIPRESAGALIRQLRALLRESPDILLQVNKDGLFYNALPVLLAWRRSNASHASAISVGWRRSASMPEPLRLM
jgi:hypothetical protein